MPPDTQSIGTTSPSSPRRRVVLVILDGWGIGQEDDPAGDAIRLASTPTWDYLTRTYPLLPLQASEAYVGLPRGQMGNSEVGHMTIGGGRVFTQDLERINDAITGGGFFHNGPLCKALEALGGEGRPLHLLGLASPGGVHAHVDHLKALVEMADTAGVATYLHLFLDGRDTPPKSAMGYLERIMGMLPPSATLATLGGRYWGMDRDKRWERTKVAYEAIALGEGPTFRDPVAFLQGQYDAGVTDEFIPPHVAQGYKGIGAGDGVMSFNFRADRIRQLWMWLLWPHGADSVHGPVPQGAPSLTGPRLGLCSYGQELDPHLATLFPPPSRDNGLGEVLSQGGLRQLRVAETEKYAHVTFFFNGGREDPLPGETRHLVPSPHVATYDLQPEMAAPEVADYVLGAIDGGQYDFIVVNFANTDMVGHTGNIPATIKAVEVVDKCLDTIYRACRRRGYTLLITADHGNAEKMTDTAGGVPHTAHTCNPVPLVVVGGEADSQPTLAAREGTLADIAPTVLTLMGLPQPPDMTGRSLVVG